MEIDLTSIPSFPDFIHEHDTVITVDYQGELNVDPRPVLDHDLDNRFIVDLASERQGLETRGLRRPSRTDHGGVAEIHFDHYVHGFEHPDAQIAWDFSVSQAGAFYPNIEYANLTGKPVSVRLAFGEQTLEAELPPTVTHSRNWRWFRKERIGCVQLQEGDRQAMRFSVTQPIDLDHQIPMEREGGEIWDQQDGFMLKAVVLKPFAPPREGVSR